MTTLRQALINDIKLKTVDGNGNIDIAGDLTLDGEAGDGGSDRSIGTTGEHALSIKTNDTERINVSNSGYVTITGDVVVLGDITATNLQVEPTYLTEFESISENTEFQDIVRAGFTLSSILIEESGGNEVRINIGTVDGGNDVLYDQLIPIEATQNLVFDRFFSKSTNQTLYISSADWNASSVNINIHTTKIY